MSKPDQPTSTTVPPPGTPNDAAKPLPPTDKRGEESDTAGRIDVDPPATQNPAKENTPPKNALLSTLVETQVREPKKKPTPVAASPLSARRAKERDRLIENYKDILNQRAIYYPVCYRFQRELGRGRQGTVHLCLRQGARGCLTRHAIKIFDPAIYKSTVKYWTDMGRIASQVSTLQTVRSPNLISLDTYDEVNGVGYLQMELVNGVDLRYLLSGRYVKAVRSICTDEEWDSISNTVLRLEDDRVSFQPGVAIYILRMVLRGLENLHAAGFVHSDIKPSNVMINALGYVQLIDYGRASRPAEKSRILLGSPMYMPPEMHERKPAIEQSDLYSVGIVGLELLRGRFLVEKTNITEDDLKEAKQNLPDILPDILPAHVTENAEFMRVLHKFVAVDPDDRFPNALVAETEQEGLRIVHKQLMQTGQDTDYLRALGFLMSKIVQLRKK